MTRKQVSDFIESAVKMLAPKTEYGRGRLSEWNSNGKHVYPKVWLVTSEEGTSTVFNPTLAPVDTFPIELRVVFKDEQDSVETGYEGLVDLADEHAQKLIFFLNQIVQSTPPVSISDISRSPLIKKNSDNVTGVILEFNLVITNTTNYCP